MTSSEDRWIVRPPRWVVLVFALFIAIIFTPWVIGDQVPTWVRLAAFLTGVGIVIRVWQIRLIVAGGQAVVINFFRTHTLPLAAISVPKRQPSVGNLVVSALEGATVTIAASPIGGESRRRVEDALRAKVQAAKA